LHNILHTVEQFFATQKLSINKVRVLVAVSGGVDSVVLLHALHQLQVNCTVLHCNFQLRGEESNTDEQFVQQLATQLQLPFLVAQFNTQQFATENNIGIQEAARILRYQWFEQQRTLIATESNTPTVIATAHHANDVVETAIFNFTRGTGIAGLHGIAACKNHIIRPLLSVFKTAIIAYANSNGLQFVEDSSNSSNKYSRNNIRNQLIPLLQQIQPQAVENIYATVQHVQTVEKVYQHTIQKIVQKLLVQKNNEYQIAIAGIQKHPFFDAILFEVATKFCFAATQLPELKKLLIAHNGSYIANANYKAINNRGWLIFTPIITTQSSYIQIDESMDSTSFEQGTIHLQKVGFATTIEKNNNPAIAYINANVLQWPLVIRKPKQGDYFYPLGLNKKKKLSRFFIDQKLSATEKEKVWIVESNQKIIWVIGFRIDHRFRVNEQCNNIVQFEWKMI
jgi:tRNA(Ile)-lysidine synthase